ncbi:MAG TPA: alpha/beta fold hydrolase [Thermoplasmata archaeon]|nr:alpha/beta fold hydrolase [Thermoplasmata archaeon]
MADASFVRPPLQKGYGTSVVFLHGYPLNRGMWATQLETLSDRHRIVLPDLPGFGTASGEPVPDTLAGFAAAVAKTLDKAIGGPATIVGHSFGGYIALQLYQDRPDLFHGLVLVSTRSEADAPEAKAKRLATAQRLQTPGEKLDVDAAAQGLVAEAVWKEQGALADAVRGLVASAPNPALVGALKAIADRPDLTPVLAKIGVPTLVVWGAADALIPPERTQTLVPAIPGARGVEIPKAGHLSPLEAPEAFDAAVKRFLPDADARRPR